MSFTIWKFKVDLRGSTHIVTGNYFQPLSVQMMPDGEIYAWAIVQEPGKTSEDDEHPAERKKIKFSVFGTGWSIPSDEHESRIYLGTVQDFRLNESVPHSSATYVWHVFYEIEK